MNATHVTSNSHGKEIASNTLKYAVKIRVCDSADEILVTTFSMVFLFVLVMYLGVQCECTGSLPPHVTPPQPCDTPPQPSVTPPQPSVTPPQPLGR